MPIVRAVPCTSVIHSAQKPFLPQRVEIDPVKPALQTRRKLPGIKRVWILPRWGAAVLHPYGRRGREFNFEIPFILVPRVFLPPVPRAVPWPRSRHNFAAHSTQINSCRLLAPHLHSDSLRRPHHAKPGHTRAYFRFFFNVGLISAAPLVLLTRNSKPLHPKAFRSVAIQQFRPAHIPVSHQFPQPRYG